MCREWLLLFKQFQATLISSAVAVYLLEYIKERTPTIKTEMKMKIKVYNPTHHSHQLHSNLCLVSVCRKALRAVPHGELQPLQLAAHGIRILTIRSPHALQALAVNGLFILCVCGSR